MGGEKLDLKVVEEAAVFLERRGGHLGRGRGAR